MTPRSRSILLVLWLAIGCGGDPSGPDRGPVGPAHAGDERPPGPDAGRPEDPDADEALEREILETTEHVVEAERPLDTDSDGLADGVDLCPGDPEDRDGDRDEDGCPEASLGDAPIVHE